MAASFLLAAWLAPPYTLEVERGTPCAELESLESRVEELLRQSSAQGPEHTLTVKHGGRPGRHTLTLSIDDGQSSQRHRFRGAQCESLVPALALMIAVTLDPLVLEPTAAPPVDDPDEEASPKPESDFVPAAQSPDDSGTQAPAPDTQPRRHGRASAGRPRAAEDRRNSLSAFQLRSSLGSGVTPALNFGVRVAFEHRFGPRFSLMVGAHHDFERVQTLEEGAGGIGVQAPVGLVRACVRALPEQWEFSGCLGGDAGAMIARSVDVPDPLVRTVAWGTANASVGLRWPRRTPVALALDLEAWVPFNRPALKFPGVTVFYRADPAGVRGLLGVEIRLGKKATQ